jgi:3-methyladenine DNA glycosylase/8-oxoguanine DNA glycosylase
MGAGVLARRRETEMMRRFYAKGVAPYAGLVVLLLIATSLVAR